MLVTANGVVTRIKSGDISRQGRPATGVKAQNLMDNDLVVSVNKIVNPDDEDEIIIKKLDEALESKKTEEKSEEIEQTSLLENIENSETGE
jgi:DNA gyrase/topoisomerase IV subunit A